MSEPLDQPLFLSSGGRTLYGVLHRPDPAQALGTGVLLCPPFGWEEVCSYRARRDWAGLLAGAGFTALRISYPGTGDSGGSPRDAELLESWTAAVGDGAAWLLKTAGMRRVTAIGLGLGAVLALRAAAGGAPLEDLVLWDAPARGRSLVRRLRALSRLELPAMYPGREPPPPGDPGDVEAGGFLLASETVAALERVDLTGLELTGTALRRVLLLERDGVAPDEALVAHLRASVADVSFAPGKGYGAMSSHPQGARTPLPVIERVTVWLSDGLPPEPEVQARAAGPTADPPTQARLGSPASEILEEPLIIPQPFGRLVGILSRPAASDSSGAPAVLFLNAGAVRHTGPNRMWVEGARRWAARGLPVLRLDVEGLGDSDGDPTAYDVDDGLYVPELVPQVLAAVDELQRRGVAARFVLAGLCAGAYWSFHAALRDRRILSAVMLNPRALVWHHDVQPARDFRALLAHPLSLRRIRRAASSQRVRALVRWVVTAPGRRARNAAVIGSIDEALRELEACGKPTLFLFSEDEPLYEELVRSGGLERLRRMPHVTLEHVAVRDHTLRPLAAQRQASAALDRALERVLAGAGSPSSDAASAASSDPDEAEPGLIQIPASE